MNTPDIRARLGLRPIVNAAGTMTYLGASIVVPEAVEAVTEILSQFVEIDDLQRKANTVIARLCATEAGFVTASCAAAITLSVAGAMTGDDLAAIERLPDARGLKDEVAILAGHMVSYGAPIEQAIRLAGAKVLPVGQATSAHTYQLEGAITPRTAAVVYVVSHHVVQNGMIALAAFAALAHAKGVPVIVDAASEYDLRGVLGAGADLALYSSHKFLGGPTGGIVAGRKHLVRAAYLQNGGIGRGMKVGQRRHRGRDRRSASMGASGPRGDPSGGDPRARVVDANAGWSPGGDRDIGDGPDRQSAGSATPGGGAAGRAYHRLGPR
jgi:D-glucosaminate-6-phosphate ammonia-lyase